MKVRGYGRNCRMVFYVTQEWRDGLVALAQDEGISTSDLLRRLVEKVSLLLSRMRTPPPRSYRRRT